jgi:hypothetical protein
VREQHDPRAARQPVQAMLHQRTRGLGCQAPDAPLVRPLFSWSHREGP